MWSSNLSLQRLIAVAMFGCISWAFGDMTMSMGLGWPQAVSTSALALAVFAAGIALGGREDGRNYRKYTDYSLVDWALLLVPILLILKLLPYLFLGADAVAEEVASWMVEPYRFWDVTLVWSLLLVVLVWDYSVRVAEHFGRLSFQPEEVEAVTAAGLPPAEIEGVYAWSQPTATPTGAMNRAFRRWERSPYRFVSHSKAWQRLMWSFIGGGFLCLIFAGLALVSPAELGDPARVELPGIIPSVLLYYVLGLILASQTSLDRLRAEWLRAGAEIQPRLARRWLSYGLALMIGALFVALLLPTSFIDSDAGLAAGGGVIGFLTTPLRIVFGGFFGALSWILAHVAAFLFAPIASLMPRGPAEPAQSTTPPPAPRGDEGVASPPATSQLIFAILLYVVPGALALYAIWNTWQKRHVIWKGLKDFFRDILAMIWGAILDAVATIWRFLGAASPGILAAAPEAIRRRWQQRRRGVPSSRPSWLRLRGLSPRELIQYFYVSLAQRAAAVGWGREPGQTAYEYSRELSEKLPGRAAEVQVLTEAFVNAKYSRRTVAEEDARRARRPWERLRGELQVRRRANRLASWFGLTKNT